MTSFIIKPHENRPLPDSWKHDPDCTFCLIIEGKIPSFKIFENDMVIAILDILPLRAGHTLVIPKTHISRVSELPSEFAAATGEAVSKVANALTLALDNTALNVVCNQEYAQAVFHVHYHIIPAPNFKGTSPQTNFKGSHITAPLAHKEMHKLELEARDELDGEDAVKLLEKIHAVLKPSPLSRV